MLIQLMNKYTISNLLLLLLTPCFISIFHRKLSYLSRFFSNNINWLDRFSSKKQAYDSFFDAVDYNPEITSFQEEVGVFNLPIDTLKVEPVLHQKQATNHR